MAYIVMALQVSVVGLHSYGLHSYGTAGFGARVVVVKPYERDPSPDCCRRDDDPDGVAFFFAPQRETGLRKKKDPLEAPS